jgi:O-antigen/teichoic acid export membrane protein
MPKEERREGFQQAIGGLMLVMTPLSIGLAAVAPSAAAAFFDKRWADVGPMLLLLSGLAFARPISSFVVSYMQILKVPRMVAISEVVSLAVLMGLLAGIGRFSPLWACAAVGIAGSLRFPLGAFFLRQAPGTSARGVAVLFVGPVLACVPLVGAVFGVRHMMGAVGLSAKISLPLEIVAGGLAYVVAIWFFAPSRSRQIFDIARPRLQRLLGRV